MHNPGIPAGLLRRWSRRLAVNPPRRPGRELTGPTGGGRPGGSFSLKPVGGAVARIERGQGPAPVAAPSLPRRVLERLKTPISDAQIQAPIPPILPPSPPGT